MAESDTILGRARNRFCFRHRKEFVVGAYIADGPCMKGPRTRYTDALHNPRQPTKCLYRVRVHPKR